MVEPHQTIQRDGAITPFWQRIPKFFLFPFFFQPLAFSVLLSAAALIGGMGVLFLILVELAIALVALRYGFRVLEQTSLGLLTPDQYEHGASAERINLPWKMLGVLLVWGMIIGIISRFSPFLGLAVRLFVSFALPASVMSLSISNSFRQGMNPVSWVDVMRGVGKPYLALWVFMTLLSTGAPTVLSLVMPMLSPGLRVPVSNYAFIYFMLVMFNMMGYCLYQYHHMLGLQVRVDFDQARDGAERPDRVTKRRDTVGEEIAAKVTAGDLAGALALSYEQQRLAQDDVPIQERYFGLLLLGDKPDNTLSQGRRLISLLLRRERADRALQIFRKCRELKPDFIPEKPGDMVGLAQAARRAGDYKFALALAREFERDQPRHADVPAARLMSAHILSENMKKDDIAADLLKDMVQKFPEHPLNGEALAFLKVMDSMKALRPTTARS